MGFLKIKEVIRPEDGFKMECIDKSNAIAVVLFNEDYSKILLVKQFRAGSNDFLYELPAGIVDQNEDEYDTMIREVREETGYIDLRDIVDLGLFYVSPGYTTEQIHLYKARISDKKTDVDFDADEIIESEWINIDDVKNKTNDMKTILGLTKALSIPKKRIGIYGGTFNPLTHLHLLTMERAIEELKLDKCIIEPVNDKYYKVDLIDCSHRKNMILTAISDNNKLMLGTYECDQYVQPNTINTLSYYKELYGWCEIYFICGSDNLKSMSTWANYSKIVEDFKVICVQRDDDNVYKDIILKDKNLIAHKNNITVIHENVVNNISSSSIRNLVRANMSIKYLVPEEIEKYINQNKLYK